MFAQYAGMTQDLVYSICTTRATRDLLETFLTDFGIAASVVKKISAKATKLTYSKTLDALKNMTQSEQETIVHIFNKLKINKDPENIVKDSLTILRRNVYLAELLKKTRDAEIGVPVEQFVEFLQQLESLK